MATAYNGYQVIGSYGSPLLAPMLANGKPFAPRLGILAGDVEWLMNDLADWLDRDIEPMDPAQSWAFTPKAVTGGSGWSCHAAATAIDYNALKHPQGKRGTWEPRQVQAIDDRLERRYKNAIRWGEHYRAPTLIDGMHFEIMAAPFVLASLVQSLKQEQQPAARPPAASPPNNPAQRKAPPTIQEESMTRIMKVGGNPTFWLVDIGAHTKWAIPSGEQLTFLRRIGVPEVNGDQPWTYLDGYKELK